MSTTAARATGRQYAVAIRAMILLTIVLGIIYPLAMTGIGQLAFPGQANGSLVKVDGKVVGSSLIGQNFTDAKGNPLPQWFQSRPSAAGELGYDPTASGGSNLGPNSDKLAKTIQERRAQVAAFNGVSPATVPADAVTASGSGLDPDISKAYAQIQVNRIAKARGLTVAQVESVVNANVQGKGLGVLGNENVNVLNLNIALTNLKG